MASCVGAALRGLAEIGSLIHESHHVTNNQPDILTKIYVRDSESKWHRNRLDPNGLGRQRFRAQGGLDYGSGQPQNPLRS